MPQDESLGALVAQASTHISTLVRAEIELVKSELKFDARRIGMATALFAAAAFILHLCLILASFTIAYVLVDALDWARWLAFLVVTVFYLVCAALSVFIGYRRLKGLSGFRRTKRSIQTLKGGEEPTLAGSSAPEIGASSEPVPEAVR